MTHRLCTPLLAAVAACCMTLACEPKQPAAPAQAPTDHADTASSSTPPAPDQATTTPTTSQTSAAVEGSDAKEKLEKLDALIAMEARMLKRSPTDWLRAARAGSAYMERARLTASWDDWDKAREWLDKSFELAPQGAGPFDQRAALNYSLHHFDQVEADLAKAEKRLMLKTSDRASIALTRGNLAFYRGDLEGARKLYSESLKQAPSPGAHVSMGVLHFNTGNVDAARKSMDAAIDATRKLDKMGLAWAMLQRGIIELDTGNLKEAQNFFAKADATYGGWYLIEEHLAEVTGALGDRERARELYEGIVARVPSGEFMEALADTYDALGNSAQAASWRARAGETYTRDMKRYPQAVYGHGMDYFLSGEDTAEAVKIARANHEVRPGYGAKVKLAQALIRTGEFEEAGKLLEESMQAGWKTAELFATASMHSSFMGKEELAREHARAATRLDREAMNDLVWLQPPAKR